MWDIEKIEYEKVKRLNMSSFECPRHSYNTELSHFLLAVSGKFGLPNERNTEVTQKPNFLHNTYEHISQTLIKTTPQVYYYYVIPKYSKSTSVLQTNTYFPFL